MTIKDQALYDANELLGMCLSLVEQEIIAGDEEDYIQAQLILQHAQLHLLMQTSLYSSPQGAGWDGYYERQREIEHDDFVSDLQYEPPDEGTY